MKIAVCFFGITRNFARYTRDSIETNLLGKVRQLDAGHRRLAHFNRIQVIHNPRGGENGVPVDPEEYKLLNCHTVAQTDQHEVDQNIDFDHIKEYGDLWRNNFVSLKNLLRQFYSLNAVTDLLLREKCGFDLVIYSRADLRFEDLVEIPRVRPRTLYTAWFERYRGLNDRFAMGDLETMVAYGRRQSMIRQFCLETGKPLSAEGYLLWYARRQGLETRHLTSINFSRVRSNGEVRDVDCGVKQKLKYHIKRCLELAGLRRC